MIRHVITARGQTLHADVTTIVQNGLNSDEIELRLGPAWDGLSLVLTLGAGSDAVRLIYSGDPVEVPASLMYAVGYLPITVTGYDEDGRVRVLSASAEHLLKVVPSGYYDGDVDAGAESGEDLLGQLVGAYDAATEAASSANAAADAASAAADAASAAAEAANTAADSASSAAEAASSAAEDAENAAVAAGEKSLYAYADPDADDRIILEYPAFLQSEDGGSVYLTLEGED